ncbi:YcgL domain-containing protein [Candidatus Spongiihabitans sp.]
MHTWIYKGRRKENTYLYITAKDNFERVPHKITWSF